MQFSCDAISKHTCTSGKIVIFAFSLARMVLSRRICAAAFICAIKWKCCLELDQTTTTTKTAHRRAHYMHIMRLHCRQNDTETNKMQCVYDFIIFKVNWRCTWFNDRNCVYNLRSMVMEQTAKGNYLYDLLQLLFYLISPYKPI